jgi:hypothetical protein
LQSSLTAASLDESVSQPRHGSSSKISYGGVSPSADTDHDPEAPPSSSFKRRQQRLVKENSAIMTACLSELEEDMSLSESYKRRQERLSDASHISFSSFLEEQDKDILRVLLVEDSKAQRKLMIRRLKGAFAQV